MMTRRLTLRSITPAVLWVLLVCTDSVAQESPEMPQPVKEHEFLKQFVGNWSTKAKCNLVKGEEPIETTGTMESRMVGGFWVINEMEGEFLGTTIQAVQTLGYDENRQKYVGTWVDSMINHVWQYRGKVDETGKKLVIRAEGPHVGNPGKMAQYRDSYEFITPDKLTTKSEIKGSDGQWSTIMSGVMTRE